MFSIFALFIKRSMGIAERKEREKQDIKDLILLKAKEILIKEGQDGLSIRKLATEIEYSPATIYLYFQDKDEILYQMMNMGFEKMAQSMTHVYALEDPLKRIYEIGRLYIEFGLHEWEWYHLMFNSASPMNHIERCKAEWGPGIAMYDYLAACCQEAFLQQGKTDRDPKIAALHLWSAAHGLVTLAVTNRFCVVEDHAHQEAVRNHLIEDTLKHIMISLFDYKI